MIGPAHPISNLRALRLGRKHNETKFEVGIILSNVQALRLGRKHNETKYEVEIIIFLTYENYG